MNSCMHACMLCEGVHMYPNTVNELSVQINLRLSALSAISTWKMYKNTIGQKKLDIFHNVWYCQRKYGLKLKGWRKERGKVRQRKDKT